MGRRSRSHGVCLDAAGMKRLSAHERLQQRRLVDRAIAHLQQGRPGPAEADLNAVLLRWPGQGDALHFLGVLRHQQGRSDQALDLLNRAVQALPAEAGPLNNLGNVHAALQQWPQAEAAYRASLALQPGGAEALANLAGACLRQGRHDEAAALYRQALALQPDNGAWRHLLAACRPQSPPARADQGYLQQVFDAVSVRFDEHLASLQYQAPQRVAATLQRLYGPPQAMLDVADLGCGTGLCAAALRPLARQLHGCDLSAGMLEQARHRGLYDGLQQQELVAFLDARPETWDLLVCADTLIYIGDLAPVMAAAARALRPGGRLIFTIEALPDDSPQPLRLQAHGRFVHRSDHVQAACAAAGLRLGEPEAFVLRFEHGTGMPGWLGVAQRPELAPQRE